MCKFTEAITTLRREIKNQENLMQYFSKTKNYRSASDSKRQIRELTEAIQYLEKYEN